MLNVWLLSNLILLLWHPRIFMLGLFSRPGRWALGWIHDEFFSWSSFELHIARRRRYSICIKLSRDRFSATKPGKPTVSVAIFLMFRPGDRKVVILQIIRLTWFIAFVMSLNRLILSCSYLVDSRAQAGLTRSLSMIAPVHWKAERRKLVSMSNTTRVGVKLSSSS